MNEKRGLVLKCLGWLFSSSYVFFFLSFLIILYISSRVILLPFSSLFSASPGLF